MIVEKGSRIPAGIESDHEVYRNTGIKKELSGFVKAQLAIQDRLNLFGDVQLRLAGFSYADKAMAIRPSYGSVEDMQWAFVNPRVGLNYNVAQGHLLYGFTGIGYREPTRFDYLQDDFAPRDIQQNEINPERVWNTELGYRLSGPFSISANLFAMEFSNQIVGTGALNPFGYAITGNVGRSWRRGAEVEYRIPLDNMWSIAGHSALCYSGIKELKQSYNPYDSIPTVVVYKNKELAFTPRQIHQIGVFFESRDKQWEGFAQVRYVSRQFLDNTENKDLQLPSFQTLDARIAYCFFSPKRERTAVKLAFRVNNILNAKYAPNGSVTGPNTIDAAGNRGQSALYLPAAGLNYFITLSFNY
jgi:iron complex outermembrane receptor protein